MAKRKTKPVSTTKTPSRSGRTVYAWIDERIRHAIDRFLASEDAPTLTKAMETAWKEYLQKRGYWPPKE